jgi:hypothetical protein
MNIEKFCFTCQSDQKHQLVNEEKEYNEHTCCKCGNESMFYTDQIK